MQVTERDIMMLFWINSWGAVSLDQIADWMMVDSATARRRVRKLCEAGLLRRLKVDFLLSTPIALTTAACSLVRDPLPPCPGIRIGTWRHDSMLVSVERQLEAHLGGWLEPERRYRSRLRLEGREISHLPDVVIHRPGNRLIAIELELTPKAPRRLQAIIDGYASSSEFAQVIYLTDDPKLASHIKRFATKFDFISIKIYRTPAQRSARPAPSKSHGSGTQP